MRLSAPSTPCLTRFSNRAKTPTDTMTTITKTAPQVRGFKDDKPRAPRQLYSCPPGGGPAGRGKRGAGNTIIPEDACPPMRFFMRVVDSKGYPGNVGLAIRDGLAAARKRDYEPVVVNLSPVPHEVAHRATNDEYRIMDDYYGVLLSVETAERDFRIYDEFLCERSAILVLIVGENEAESAAETLRFLETPGLIRMVGGRLGWMGRRCFFGGKLGKIASIEIPEGSA